MKYKIALTAALTNRMWKFIDYFSLIIIAIYSVLRTAIYLSTICWNKFRFTSLFFT